MKQYTGHLPDEVVKKGLNVFVTITGGTDQAPRNGLGSVTFQFHGYDANVLPEPQREHADYVIGAIKQALDQAEEWRSIWAPGAQR